MNQLAQLGTSSSQTQYFLPKETKQALHIVTQQVLPIETQPP